MPAIRINAAAAMLGVSPSTLRSWERRFGFPTPRRSAGGHRQFALEEIELLRAALAQSGEISSAIALARARGHGPPSADRLAQALIHFDREGGDRILEESLAVRTLERTVEEVVLAALARLERERPLSPEHFFGWRYATGWVASLQRLAPPANRPEGVLLLDATAPFELDALYVQALELFLRRAGLRLLTLPTTLQPARLGAAVQALRPCALVLCGEGATLDRIARLVYATRRVCAGAAAFDFRGALPDTGATTVSRLAERPSEAAGELCALLGQAPVTGPRRALARSG